MENFVQALHLRTLDDDYKVIYAKDTHGREATYMIRILGFEMTWM